MSSRRYNSRTTFTHLPLVDRKKTFEANPESDLESARERLRLVICSVVPCTVSLEMVV
jgi:hypothetical protein